MIGCRRRGDQLRIEVVDSGAGIPRDQQRNIFHEFYQLPATARDRLGGMGLGLSIVESIGVLLKHPVELISRPGRGSRFAVAVPLAASGVAAEPLPSPASIGFEVSGKLILVIDDDQLVLDGMRGILQSWGCHVVLGKSSETTLKLLADQRRAPDLIISDYHLGHGETGIEAVGRVRAAVGAAVPAFFISGDTSPERLQDTRESGYHLLHEPRICHHLARHGEPGPDGGASSRNTMNDQPPN